MHEIAPCLGEPVCRALPFFQALTWCDTTSFFLFNVGKKTAWETWKLMPEMTAIFDRLGGGGNDEQVSGGGANLVNGNDFEKIQRFIIVMYSRSSPHSQVNKARHAMFANGRSIECIPPTEAVLLQHVKRAILQSKIWRSCLCPRPEQLSPADYGWQKLDSDTWVPFWSDLPVVSDALQNLVRCSCKKRCSGNCTYCQYGLKCTAPCACSTTSCSRLVL